MNLHPDIEALLEMVQAGTESGARTPFPQLTAVQARADFDASSPLLDVDPPALACERHLSLPMRDGAMIGYVKLGPPHLPFEPRGEAAELRQLYVVEEAKGLSK